MLIDGKSFFEIPIKNNEETYKQIIEMITRQVICWIMNTFQNIKN